MKRKELLQMLPYWVDALREAGEEKIAVCLDAIRYSIEKENDGNQNHITELELFAQEVMRDFPAMRNIQETIIKKKKEELLRAASYYFELVPTPGDPKRFC